jgi:nucleoside-diphosphate-sugar epimerase
MNIVLTGGTSFTGYHFASELSKKNKVILPLRKKKIFYKKIRERLLLNNLKCNKNIELKFDCKFNTKKFYKFLEKKKINIFCFHHFDVGNLNKNFNFQNKLNSSLLNIEKFFIFLKKKNCKSLIFSSTSIQKKIFLQKQYFTDDNRKNYAWAKNILFLIVKFLCKKYSINFKNYFISQPFGPFEKPSSLSNFVYKNSNRIINLQYPKRILQVNKIYTVAKNYAKFVSGYKTKLSSKECTVQKFKEDLLFQLKKKKEIFFGMSI